MLIDRPNIVEGSSIQNATVASGSSTPANPSLGELFYNTSLGQLQAFNGSTWAAITNAADFAAHLADATLHLTAAQNALLDGLVATLTSTELNYVDGVTSPIQTQLNTIVGVNSTQDSTLASLQSQITSNAGSSTAALNTHIADQTLHLTSAQNTFMDALNLPSLTAADINNVPALNSSVLGLISQYNAHVADASVHLTSAQNTFLDGVSYGTVGFSDLNRLNGLDGFLGGGALATYLSNLNTNKLNRDGTQSMTGALGMAGFRITALGSPVNATDAATKDYVDQLSQGLSWKETALVATTANITLSGAQVVDGVSVTTNNRVLVKNQSNQAENGVYLASTGAWSRSADTNSAVELDGMAIFVRQGTVHQDTAWVQLNTLATFPGDSVVYSQFAAAGGATAGQGILIAGSTISARVGNGLTFSGQNITLNVSGAFALGSLLDLSNTGIGAGTYRSVTVDAKGRVTTGTNPTTVAGYGITDAVLKTGDTMTGDLFNTAGSVIRNTAPSASNAWFSTVAYGISQGDGKTHFGYNNGSQYGNYLRGAFTEIPGALNVFGAGSFQSNAQFGRNGSVGYTNLNPGNASNPGYLEFFTADNVRRGYVGWSDGSNRMLFASEAGWNWAFSQAPLVGGSVVLHAGNYNSYAPTLTGGNASGTWGINITGSAGGVAWSNVSGKPTQSDWNSVGSGVNVVGMLGWKNYGNAHVIFDASNGTTPSGGAISNSVPQVAWSATYPTLMGWNGAQTYGVKVNRADVADVASTLQGYTASVAAAGNTVVLRDSNGYIFNSYINTTDDLNSSGVQGVIVKLGDNYHRTATAAGIAAFLNGQNFNIAGSSGSTVLANKASTLAQNGGNGAAMTFNWAGQGGQPTWLWGGNDGVNHYVYNPSNFSVNYATTAGNVSSISSAVGGSYAWTAQQSFVSGGSNTSLNGSSGVLMPQSPNASTAATMSFHRPGAYGLNMGLDNDNVFRIGGWSAAPNRLQLDMSGNLTIAGNFYPSNGANYLRGPTGSYGGLEIVGTSGGYGGISFASTSSGTHIMYDTGGNGGSFDSSTGWHTYWNRGDSCLGIGGSNTLGGYRARINGAVYVDGAVTTNGSAVNTQGGALNLSGGTVNAGTINGGTVNVTTVNASGGEVYTNGGIRIQNGSPTITFQDTDNMTASIHVNSNLLYVLRNPTPNSTGWDSGPNGRHPMTLDLSNGNVTFSGNVTAYSDRRLKRDIEPIYNALDKVSRLQGVSYKRLDTDDFEIGVIAQDTQKVMPEVVKEDADGYLSVAYGNMTALLIEAVKELKAEVQALKAELATLKG